VTKWRITAVVNFVCVRARVCVCGIKTATRNGWVGDHCDMVKPSTNLFHSAR